MSEIPTQYEQPAVSQYTGGHDHEPPLHPHESLLRKNESIEIDPTNPLPYFPASDENVLALLSLPRELLYLDAGRVALHFSCKYALSVRSHTDGRRAYGISAYNDRLQSLEHTFRLDPAVEYLIAGRDNLRLGFATQAARSRFNKTLAWDHQAIEPLGRQLANLVSRTGHFRLDFSEKNVRVTDVSRYGTRVLKRADETN